MNQPALDLDVSVVKFTRPLEIVCLAATGGSRAIGLVETSEFNFMNIFSIRFVSLDTKILQPKLTSSTHQSQTRQRIESMEH